MERGEYEMLYCKEANLMALKWIDIKAVHIISSLINSDVAKVERRKKGQAEKIRADCPEIVKNYNKYMGGVDMHDQLKTTHEQDRRGKRYYLRLAFDMLNQLMVNSRIVYNTLNPENTLTAKEYQITISQGIVGDIYSRSHGKSILPFTYNRSVPNLSAQMIVENHLPFFSTRGRCRYCRDVLKKDSKSYIHCSSCKVPLCLNKERNCFFFIQNTLPSVIVVEAGGVGWGGGGVENWVNFLNWVFAKNLT